MMVSSMGGITAASALVHGYDSPALSQNYRRAIVRPAPADFTVQILDPVKYDAWHYGLRIIPAVGCTTKSGRRHPTYDIYRRWEDCLDLQKILEKEWARLTKIRKSLMKAERASGALYPSERAASFESLPSGPSALSKNLADCVPKLSRKGTLFRATTMTAEQRGEEFQNLIRSLFDQESMAMADLRKAQPVLDWFAWWKRDRDSAAKKNAQARRERDEEKLRAGRNSLSLSINTSSSASSKSGITPSPSSLSYPVPPEDRSTFVVSPPLSGPSFRRESVESTHDMRYIGSQFEAGAEHGSDDPFGVHAPPLSPPIAGLPLAPARPSQSTRRPKSSGSAPSGTSRSSRFSGTSIVVNSWGTSDPHDIPESTSPIPSSPDILPEEDERERGEVSGSHASTPAPNAVVFPHHSTSYFEISRSPRIHYRNRQISSGSHSDAESVLSRSPRRHTLRKSRQSIDSAETELFSELPSTPSLRQSWSSDASSWAIRESFSSLNLGSSVPVIYDEPEDEVTIKHPLLDLKEGAVQDEKMLAPVKDKPTLSSSPPKSPRGLYKQVGAPLPSPQDANLLSVGGGGTQREPHRPASTPVRQKRFLALSSQPPHPSWGSPPPTSTLGNGRPSTSPSPSAAAFGATTPESDSFPIKVMYSPADCIVVFRGSRSMSFDELRNKITQKLRETETVALDWERLQILFKAPGLGSVTSPLRTPPPTASFRISMSKRPGSSSSVASTTFNVDPSALTPITNQAEWHAALSGCLDKLTLRIVHAD